LLEISEISVETEQMSNASAESNGQFCEIGTIVSPDAPEIKVRDYFVARLKRMCPSQHPIATEQRYAGCGLRADLRTIDHADLLREWEFKLHADYRAIGQILAYVALARKELAFRPVRGVIAAFSFSPEVPLTNEVMNLGLELITIPEWMRAAGGLPLRETAHPPLPIIPPIALS
jgi:hypothetical protein